MNITTGQVAGQIEALEYAKRWLGHHEASALLFDKAISIMRGLAEDAEPVAWSMTKHIAEHPWNSSTGATSPQAAQTEATSIADQITKFVNSGGEIKPGDTFYESQPAQTEAAMREVARLGQLMQPEEFASQKQDTKPVVSQNQQISDVKTDSSPDAYSVTLSDKSGETALTEAQEREAFEEYWRETRGKKKAYRELQRHELQPQTYRVDSANRHWTTFQAWWSSRSTAQPCG